MDWRTLISKDTGLDLSEPGAAIKNRENGSCSLRVRARLVDDDDEECRMKRSSQRQNHVPSSRLLCGVLKTKSSEYNRGMQHHSEIKKQ